MLVRNFLKAGCYATVVPIGIPITVRYGGNGMVDLAARGYTQENVCDFALLDLFLENDIVPRTVPTDGTCWVQGILFTHNMILDGAVGDTIADKLYDKFLKDTTQFKFYAGNAISTSREFPNATATNQWLGIAKFPVLPGFIVPTDVTSAMLDHIINNGSYTFDYPLVAGFWVWNGPSREYYSNDLQLLNVETVQEFVDPLSGRVLMKLDLGADVDRCVEYYDAIKYNVQSGDILLMDYTGDLVYNFMRQQIPGPIYYTCKTCGAKFIVSPDQPLQCNNTHCTSLLYPAVSRFLQVLGFESVTIDEYKSIIETCGKAFMLPDILELSKFENVKKDVTIAQILEATIPEKYLPKSSTLIASLLKDSNSAINTVLYYLENFDRFLQSTPYQVDCNIESWLNDGRNLLELHAVVDNPHINLVGDGKKFDGAPIFRGKTIIVTGKFLHGTFDDIKAIFASYSGETINVFDNTADCLVIGDMQEDINGSIINQCRKMNMPVFGETEFFARYEIDSDMSQNL